MIDFDFEKKNIENFDVTISDSSENIMSLLAINLLANLSQDDCFVFLEK